MLLTLTVGDLRNSPGYGSPYECPIATAIKRSHPSFSPSVGVQIVYNMNNNKCYVLFPPYYAHEYTQDYLLRDDPETPDSEIVRTFILR